MSWFRDEDIIVKCHHADDDAVAVAPILINDGSNIDSQPVLIQLNNTTVIDTEKALVGQDESVDKAVAPSTRESATLSSQHTITNITTLPLSTLPPLDSLITGTERSDNITGDPQFLLDFGVVGFAKAGTTTMKNLLCSHKQAVCEIQEVRDLNQGKLTHFIDRQYHLSNSTLVKRGYKCPNDIPQVHVVEYYRQYFPSTRVFVGIRHPISWFASFYNFRIQNGSKLPHPNTLIGGCYRGRGNVCTNRGLFHVLLARLNKTSMTAPEEVQLQQQYPRHFLQDHSLPNPLFLFATEQLSDTNTTRLDIFRQDVQHFVGFDEEMPPIPHTKPGIERSDDIQEKLNQYKIDICDSQYKQVREALMDIARPASIWIRNYFIESDSVVVSSKEHFREILETWMVDPCQEKETDEKKNRVKSLLARWNGTMSTSHE